MSASKGLAKRSIKLDGPAITGPSINLSWSRQCQSSADIRHLTAGLAERRQHLLARHQVDDPVKILRSLHLVGLFADHYRNGADHLVVPGPVVDLAVNRVDLVPALECLDDLDRIEGTGALDRIGPHQHLDIDLAGAPAWLIAVLLLEILDEELGQRKFVLFGPPPGLRAVSAAHDVGAQFLSLEL